MNFHVGQKVVYVDDRWPSLWAKLRSVIYPPPGDQPVLNAVYTVAAIHPFETWGAAIELHELYSPASRHWGAGFLSYGFRPLIERKTDIGALTALLDPANHKHMEKA